VIGIVIELLDVVGVDNVTLGLVVSILSIVPVSVSEKLFPSPTAA